MPLGRKEYNSGFGARDRQLNPSLCIREFLIRQDTESELFRVEPQCSILVAHRNTKELDSFDHIVKDVTLEIAKSRSGLRIAAALAIAMITIAMKVDPYILDTLMRDLVAHSRSSAAFLVYLQLYRHTHKSTPGIGGHES